MRQVSLDTDHEKVFEVENTEMLETDFSIDTGCDNMSEINYTVYEKGDIRTVQPVWAQLKVILMEHPYQTNYCPEIPVMTFPASTTKDYTFLYGITDKSVNNHGVIHHALSN